MARRLASSCSLCQHDMTDYEPDKFASECPACGKGLRTYWDGEGTEFLARLPIGRVVRKYDLEPGYPALAAQVWRRMDRLKALYDESYTLDAHDVLDEVDALFVSIFHLSDWLKADPDQQKRWTPAEIDALYSRYPLELTRAYANTYKHLVLNERKVSKKKPYRLYAKVERYERDGKNRPVVMIHHWAKPAGEYYSDGSVEALQLANECLAALAEFGKAHGDPSDGAVPAGLE